MTTKMKSTTIRFDEDVLKMVHKQAKLDGKNSTEFMRDAILEKLADTLDYNEAIINLRASDGETVSREEVLKDLGLN
ncbi:hypothetical protein FP435_01095 [Lactobacillus sp. PV037]|uniref:DUF6290 family protein n=1 Tax=unclassified Lactobacillus TaxID=2620435 RepID=UPI0022406A1E|nr:MULTISPECIES: DUF6290 family protein [unclassified Lactobacillus]QNQ82748.1 hypothetical protein FP433_06710 [Lactobacillus sp. PV012]QNQ83132.1 hypothetical protein FP435_01095 [Lactobacillus sp. PV037]